MSPALPAARLAVYLPEGAQPMESFLPQGPGTGHARGAVVVGADGHLVDAVARITAGPAGLFILGLPETGTREARDRIRAAILNSALPCPPRAIAVDLLPASLPKRGTSLDLAIAVAMLTAIGAIPADAANGYLFAAGLGLDGRMRPVPGVLPMVLAAAGTGCTRAIVAPGNAAEAATVPGVTATGCQSLQAAPAWLRCQPLPGQDATPGRRACAWRWKSAQRAATI
jgi:magnesium chelatase family protein